MDCLEHTKVDLVVADVGLANDGATNLLRRMRTSSRLAGIPTLGLGDAGHAGNGASSDDLHFDEYQTQSDRDALLAAIARMVNTAHGTDVVPALAGQRS
jgi:hypothetical protein